MLTETFFASATSTPPMVNGSMHGSGIMILPEVQQPVFLCSAWGGPYQVIINATSIAMGINVTK